MKFREEDTPPSSINGDEIHGFEINDIEDDDLMYLEEMDEMDDMDEMDEMEEMEEFQEDLRNSEEVDQGREDEDLPEDQSIILFNKHKGSVFCCNLHPDGKFAVTGGEDDKAFVWSTETGEIITECTGHKDSVIFVGFSFDGAFLATVDMSGLIKVWKCNFESTQEWPVVFEYEAGDLNWGLWHFGTRVLICGGASGDIFVFKIPSGDTKILPGHNVKTECGKLFSDGVRLVSGYEDGTVKIWDLKTNSVLQQVPQSVHQTRVTAVDTNPEDNIVASISLDGKAVLTTSVNGKIVGQLETESELEAVAFSNQELGYIALGTLKGTVTIWDVGRKMIRHYCSKKEDNFTAATTKMFWINDELITGCLDGSIRIYDGRTGERNLKLTGHWMEILDLCYNEKQNIILSSSDDGAARIFKYEAKSEIAQ